MAEPAFAEVILLDALGRPVGSAPKLSAHQPPGALHSAFSIFIRDSSGRHLLQQRAWGKYHFAGRWANACCGHPAPGEKTLDAALKRLEHEMGIITDLSPIGAFIYRAVDEASGLLEHERDELYVGLTDLTPDPDPGEVGDWAWIGSDELQSRITSNPVHFAPWLIVAFEVFPQLITPS
jgi:isopentenyl-diphosphate delta-isomerase